LRSVVIVALIARRSPGGRSSLLCVWRYREPLMMSASSIRMCRTNSGIISGSCCSSQSIVMTQSYPRRSA
jgi:hypothetical protein